MVIIYYWKMCNVNITKNDDYKILRRGQDLQNYLSHPLICELVQYVETATKV